MTPLFGPGWGNYAIQGIIETSLPAQVSLRPATPAWWILVGLVIGTALYWIFKRRQRYLKNAYRREAQRTLNALEAAYNSGDRDCLRQLAPLLRATALQATANREQLAAVAGEPWQKALLALAPKLPPLPVRQLEALAYQPLSEADQDWSSLFAQLREWVAAHESRNA